MRTLCYINSSLPFGFLTSYGTEKMMRGGVTLQGKKTLKGLAFVNREECL